LHITGYSGATSDSQNLALQCHSLAIFGCDHDQVWPNERSIAAIHDFASVAEFSPDIEFDRSLLNSKRVRSYLN
jgi:hypothetical protein